MRTSIGRWRRRERPTEGRLSSLGQDYQRGHLDYVERSGEAGLVWLHNKPFSAPPGYELGRCLHSFVHIVEQLRLGFRAKILDIGCGPGWLSEYLARCGYAVTGVDVSPDMVEIARQRVAAIQEPITLGVEPVAEFHAMPVLELPWREQFDAAVLYDTMHHFDDELETLRVIRQTLVPGGRVYLHEGVKPDPGSPGERSLIAEMEQFGTLESPFDPAYLVQVVEQAGFTDLRRLLEIDELVNLSEHENVQQRISERLARPDTNTLVAVNPIPLPEGDSQGFSARIEAADDWRSSPDGDELLHTVVVVNTGTSLWPASLDFPFPPGSVNVAPYLESGGGRAELPRRPLPRSLAAGEWVGFELRVPRAHVHGHDRVIVDLSREGVAWFSELGSEPLVLLLPTD
jgi:SAM-dependent methyltransferase